MYGSLSPGDVAVADALFDNYFIACELRRRGIELVARKPAVRVGRRTVESRPDGESSSGSARTSRSMAVVHISEEGDGGSGLPTPSYVYTQQCNCGCTIEPGSVVQNVPYNPNSRLSTVQRFLAI
jgi:hypothetical protein